MIRINLLPVRTSRKRETIVRQVVLAGIGLLALLAVCGFLWQRQLSEVSSVENKNDKLTKEIDTLKKVIGSVDEYKTKAAELEKKLEIIKTLKANKVGPVHMLDELSTAIPDKCWLTSLTETNKQVKLSGVAVSNEVIANFYNALEASDYFDELLLGSIKQKTNKDVYKLKEFTITAKVVTPEEKRARMAASGLSKPVKASDVERITEAESPVAPAQGASPAEPATQGADKAAAPEGGAATTSSGASAPPVAPKAP